jgi:hypothetical protein
MKENAMKKKTSRIKTDDVRPEYNFQGGVRGKHYAQYQQGTNFVLIEPDLMEVFTDAAAVNQALRQYVRQTQSSRRRGTAISVRAKQPRVAAADVNRSRTSVGGRQAKKKRNN